MINKCVFCDSDVTHIGEYAICEHCKVAYPSKRTDAKTTYRLIREYLSEKQKSVLLKRDAIYELEQKKLSGYSLTDEENRDYNCLKKFQDSRVLLELTANGNFAWDDKNMLHALYELVHNEEQLNSFLAK